MQDRKRLAPWRSIVIAAVLATVAALMSVGIGGAADGPSVVNLDASALSLPVGTTVTITAAGSDPAVAGLPVRFNVAGVNGGFDDSCTTDVSGACSISYAGGLFSAGTDFVHAFIDTNDDTLQEVGEPENTITITWLGPSVVNLDASALSLPVGTTVTITAAGSDPAVAGLPVRFNVAGVNGGFDDSCTTDATGACSISYAGGLFSAGTDFVHAFIDTNDDAQQEAGEPENTIAITWVGPSVLTGFGTPVAAEPQLNRARAGQVIPLRFSVADAAGMPVTNLTSVQVTVVDIGCSAGSTSAQPIESAAGGSGLQNLGGGNYQFNWATPKAYASSCKELRLTLSAADGAAPPLVALFEFKS